MTDTRVKGFDDVYSTLMNALCVMEDNVQKELKDREDGLRVMNKPIEGLEVYKEHLQEIDDARQYLNRNKPL